jgi:acyl transferase domain-containing protein
MTIKNDQNLDSMAVAVIGLSCRFPGAANIEEFWNNLKNGVESVEILSQEDLQSSGVAPELLANPNYVRAAPTLADIELFDAGFFGFSPGEAKILDPQRRLFLECGWEAFESAGYDPLAIEDPVAVYGSAGINQYFNTKLVGNEEILRTAGEQQILISNDKDHLPTHLSYKLNLKGPSVNVNTACSSSLVAIHLARLSLLVGECDMAIAGGSAIMVPNKAGYLYVEDSILSKDGHCRAFDDSSSGTLWGSGCGVVLLKRLPDAIRDKDNIRAIIRGSAINNDGNDKVGYTAPSVKGQADVVIQALASADLEPADISYIEAHGTGTKLGDPIEVAALTEVFAEFDQSDSQCLIGSVKPNIGHLGAAAGVASFIKTVLALENAQIPPSINFSKPNSSINFGEIPFTVNDRLTEWNAPVRRAGISSLAVGGTNCHIVLEQAPITVSTSTAINAPVAILLSARTDNALAQAALNLIQFSESNPYTNLQDIAFTLQFGRHTFAKKAVVFAKTLTDLITQLKHVTSQETSHYFNINNKNEFSVPANLLNASIAEIQSWLDDEEVYWASEIQQYGKRIELPTYPFERQRYWVDFDRQQANLSDEFKLNNKTGTMTDWFYEQSWQRKSLQPRNDEHKARGEQWLVFSNNNSLTNRFIDEIIGRGDPVIVVTQGKTYQRVNENQITLNPEDFSHYDLLINDLAETFELPSRVMHFWGVEAKIKDQDPLQVETFRYAQFRGYYSVLNLVQALNRHKFNADLTIKIFTNDLHEITGNEKIRPEKSATIGLVKVLQQEFQNITCQAIDIYLPSRGSDDEKTLVSSLVEESIVDSPNIICAYRNGRRWVQSYERILIDADAVDGYPIKDAGVYLVYDGLVGIGLEVSKTLLTENKATVLVLGDVSMPAEADWDRWLAEHDPKEDISVKIGGFRELQALGGIFIAPMPADNNVDQLERIVSSVEKKYGTINGVIHCSGGSANGHVRAVNKATHELTERDFITVPYALIALDKVFEKRTPDFRLVMSSLGSILGGILFVSYGSSNCLVSSFAEYNNKVKDYRWNVQCWDSWDIEWQIQDYKNTTLHGNITDRLRAIALTVPEGLECFRRSLSYNSSHHITISSTDLQARIDKWVNKSTMANFKVDLDKSSVRHPRPAISVDFSQPEGQEEKIIAGAFEKLLDIDHVGRLDNFFELGGHSLLATQLITELRTLLNVDMAISDVLENPTIAQLAQIAIGEPVIEAS